MNTSLHITENENYLITFATNEERSKQLSSYRERYQDFYNSKEWKELRAWKFAEANGLCEECRENGKIVVGKEVHHKVSIESDWSKRLDPKNLKLLCPECHRLSHERGSPLQEFNKFWESL